MSKPPEELLHRALKRRSLCREVLGVLICWMETAFPLALPNRLWAG